MRLKGLRSTILNRLRMKCFRLPIVLSFLLITVALASSFQEGLPLKGEVVKAELLDKKKQDWKLLVKLLEAPKVAPSGYYNALDYKKGSVVESQVKRSQHSFQKGDKITLRWRSYSAMGPNGPVGGLSWPFISKP